MLKNAGYWKFLRLLLIGLIFMPLFLQAQKADKDSIFLYTQQLINGIAEGDASAWSTYLDDSCLITSEDGTVKSKEIFIKGIGRPPSLFTVAEKIKNPIIQNHGNVIVFCYTAVLSLKVLGQERITQICQTDTWMKKGSVWRLVCSEALDKPTPPVPQMPNSFVMKAITGKYEIADTLGFKVFVDSEKTYIQRYGASKKELKCENDFVFFTETNPLLRYVFIHKGNKILRLEVRRQGSGISYFKLND